MRNGLRVSKAGNAELARQMLSAYAIDFILLDVMMPGEDGLALTVFIRATSAVPARRWRRCESVPRALNPKTND